LKSDSWNIRGLVFSALFAALFIVFSAIKLNLGISAVPFTLQSFAIMLTGGLLGARYGFYSIFVVIALTAIGLPLLHGEGGWTLVSGRTAGFIWMFPIAACLIGWLCSKIKGKSWVTYVLLFLVMEVFGSLLLYVSGIPWFAHVTKLSLSESLVLAAYPFLITDMIKALIAAAIVLSLRSYMPKLTTAKST
jgi:biotin transport system substrate-specific component